MELVRTSSEEEALIFVEASMDEEQASSFSSCLALCAFSQECYYFKPYGHLRSPSIHAAELLIWC
jgi:hypothetical protein